MKRPHGFDSSGRDTRPLPDRAADKRSPEAAPGVVAPAPVDPELPELASGPVIEQPESPTTAVHTELAEQTKRARDALKDLKLARKTRKKREKGERRRFTQLSRVRKRRWLIAAVSVAALALFVTIGVFSPAMTVQKIEVIGASRLDSVAVVESVGFEIGQPLVSVDAQKIHDALTQFPLIQKYSIETQPPNTLVIRVIERQPVINIKRGKQFDLVDSAGVVIQTADARIPGFALADGLVVDVNSPAFEATASALANMQPELAAQVDIASATTDQDVTFKLVNGITIIWGSADESAKKSILATKMMAALAGRNVSTINVSSTEAPVFS